MNPDGHIEDPVKLPKCKHLFGDHCLKEWLKDSDSCPYCRDKLDSTPKRPHHSTSSRNVSGRSYGIPASYFAHEMTAAEFEMYAASTRYGIS